MTAPMGGLESYLYSQLELPGCGHRCPILAALMPGTSAHKDGDSLASDPQLHHSQTKEVTTCLSFQPRPQPLLLASSSFLKSFFLVYYIHNVGRPSPLFISKTSSLPQTEHYNH